jgi:hypothetical protein
VHNFKNTIWIVFLKAGNWPDNEIPKKYRRGQLLVALGEYFRPVRFFALYRWFQRRIKG